MKNLIFLIFTAVILCACSKNAFLKQRYTRNGHAPLAKHDPKGKADVKSHDEKVKFSTTKLETKEPEKSPLTDELFTEKARADLGTSKNKTKGDRFVQRLDKLAAVNPEVKEEIEKLVVAKQKKGVVFENITYYAYGLLVLAVLVAALLVVFDVWDVGL